MGRHAGNVLDDLPDLVASMRQPFVVTFPEPLPEHSMRLMETLGVTVAVSAQELTRSRDCLRPGCPKEAEPREQFCRDHLSAGPPLAAAPPDPDDDLSDLDMENARRVLDRDQPRTEEPVIETCKGTVSATGIRCERKAKANGYCGYHSPEAKERFRQIGLENKTGVAHEPVAATNGGGTTDVLDELHSLTAEMESLRERWDAAVTKLQEARP